MNVHTFWLISAGLTVVYFQVSQAAPARVPDGNIPNTIIHFIFATYYLILFWCTAFFYLAVDAVFETDNIIKIEDKSETEKQVHIF